MYKPTEKETAEFLAESERIRKKLNLDTEEKRKAALKRALEDDSPAMAGPWDKNPARYNK